MGAACCVAANNRTIVNGSSRDYNSRINRYSPTWEEASVYWFSGDLGSYGSAENKSYTTVGTAYASDNGPAPAVNEPVTTSYIPRSKWYFDNEPVNANHDKTSTVQTCGICSMLLTKRPSLGTDKYIPANEVPVVAILMCGHVYHSECLEQMTSDINKYDPACPVCTFGEKEVVKLAEKANGDNIMFDNHKISPKMRSSSSMKSSLKKPFLKRHFAFGSKGSRSLSDNNSSRKKGFFWAKSSKE